MDLVRSILSGRDELHDVMNIVLSQPRLFAALLLFSGLILLLLRPGEKLPNAPVYGYRSIFDPTLFLRFRFITSAYDIIKAGYKEMKDRPFVLLGYDAHFLVLPNKYLEEIRLVPVSKLGGIGAQASNLAPKWTSMEFVLRSRLHVDVIRKKMTPELFKYVDMAYEELAYGWGIDVPIADNWTEASIEDVVRMLVACVSARVFMGQPACRDPAWLNLSINFTIDLFMTAMTLRMFPSWSYWLIVWLIPGRYRIRNQLTTARKYVEANEKRSRGEKAEEQDILMHWMLDNGTPTELHLSHCGIHTTASSISNILYDLCAYSEWFPVLRQEIDEIAQDLGPPARICSPRKCGATDWTSLTASSWKASGTTPSLFSTPRERPMNPSPSKMGLISPPEPDLHSPTLSHQMDPETFEDSEAFDPMRSFRKRQSAPDQKDLHKAGLTHPNNLVFGYGNQACTGRHFAVAEVKLIVFRLLYEFEFKFPDGKSKPKRQTINENVFTDPTAKLMMRKRRV
ncbi:Cytochrome P450 monooxygenase ATR4 [Cladobotryum mycophilum]|uniref:Cytochrome P450 monooxygenase ATR4 n=1 Tax=Cladobotryum mycophilum TaxID=491253 RepID=A0ABR0S825_9HYPO